MSFTYPLGLLGLIGVPILILLYIIKSHYTEQTVASVYLWQLSEKFLKKRKRMRFGGLLSLILEILAVVAISLTIAGPKFILPDAANDYCFVLDASGSMTGKAGQTTRFEAGKEQIREVIEQSKDGSTYTLIYAGSTTFEAVQATDDREVALSVLDALECEWAGASCVDAVSVAQSYCTADHAPQIYLVTDKSCDTENITLINVAQTEENYAFVSCDYVKSGNMTVVTGTVISCDRDAEILVKLYVDGQETAQCTVEAAEAVATAFILETEATTFESLTLQIVNEDDLPTDNQVILYTTGQTQNNKTLLVSDKPAYLKFALTASDKTDVEVVATADYNANSAAYTGYGLYIFDTGAIPEELPKNAAIWFFNLQQSISGTGFSFREVVEAESVPTQEEQDDAEQEPYFIPEYTTATSSTVKTFMQGMLKQNIALKKYALYGTSRSNFTTLLYQQNGNVLDNLIFIGNNENGSRQVVFAFDLHDTDFAMKADFLILLNNLLDYSFPAVIEQTQFQVGQSLTVNVPSGCTDLLLEAPSGKISYPDFSGAVASCELTQAGTYKVTVCINDVQQHYYVHAGLSAEESYEPTAEKLAVEKQSDSSASDGYYDKLIIYFIILALALLMDWGVYCYEQYQLR